MYARPPPRPGQARAPPPPPCRCRTLQKVFHPLHRRHQPAPAARRALALHVALGGGGRRAEGGGGAGAAFAGAKTGAGPAGAGPIKQQAAPQARRGAGLLPRWAAPAPPPNPPPAAPRPPAGRAPRCGAPSPPGAPRRRAPSCTTGRSACCGQRGMGQSERGGLDGAGRCAREKGGGSPCDRAAVSLRDPFPCPHPPTHPPLSPHLKLMPLMHSSSSLVLVGTIWPPGGGQAGTR
jgi:hypothetical protein